MGEAMATWLVVFLVGLVIVIFFAIPAMLAFRMVRTRKEEFYCPWVHRNVAVQFVTLDGERPVGVLSCSAFPDTTGVLCGMPCLATAGRGQPAERSESVLDLLND
jgi:hypothetical protein